MNLLRNMLREKVLEQIGDFNRNSIERVSGKVTKQMFAFYGGVRFHIK